MTSILRVWWDRELFRALLMAATVFVGVLLPLDFLAQIDGYLMYLRPWQLLPLFALGWIIYALLGIGVGILAILPPLLLAKLMRRPSATLVGSVSAWLTLTFVLLCLLKHGKTWLAVEGFALAAVLVQAKWPLVALVAVGCAVWVWRHGVLPAGMNTLMRLSATGGLLLAIISPLTAWWGSPAASASVAGANIPLDGSKRPNIILISIDTFSANHASLYGYGRPTTPQLERLGQQAHVFERHYANSNFTTPTVNSFIHGVRPWTHRANQIMARVDSGIAEQGTVARLKGAGYQTFAVSTNPYAAPFNIRVDEWLDRGIFGRVRSSLHIAMTTVCSRLPSAFPIFDLATLQNVYYLDPLMVGAGLWRPADHFDPELAFSAARNLARGRELSKPMFLWVHLFQPHAPFATEPPFVGRFDASLRARTRFDSPPKDWWRDVKDFRDRYMGRYDEGIASVDYHMGLFIDWLKENDLFDDALLLVTADHGESFSHGFPGHGGPMLHDDLIRIPLIIKEPAQKIGKRLDVVAEQIDLMPTVLDLAGIRINAHVEGKSLKPAMLGEKLERPAFSMNFEQSNRFGNLHTGSVAMIDGRWKYVHYVRHSMPPQMPNSEDSLYDLQTDQDEYTNLVASRPEVATRMLAAVEQQLMLHGGSAQ